MTKNAIDISKSQGLPIYQYNIDKNTSTEVGIHSIQIIGEGDNLYCLSIDGSIWKYNNQPDSWNIVSAENQANFIASKIEVIFDTLFAIQKSDNSLWQYVDAGNYYIWVQVGANTSEMIGVCYANKIFDGSRIIIRSTGTSGDVYAIDFVPRPDQTKPNIISLNFNATMIGCSLFVLYAVDASTGLMYHYSDDYQGVGWKLFRLTPSSKPASDGIKPNFLIGNNDYIFYNDINTGLTFCCNEAAADPFPIQIASAVETAAANKTDVYFIHKDTYSVSSYNIATKAAKSNITVNASAVAATDDSLFYMPFDGTQPTLDELNELVAAYGPVVYLADEEQYNMSGVESHIENSYLVNNATKTQVQASLQNLPQGQVNREKYHLALKSEAARSGNPATAKAYIHVKGNLNYTDLQCWFFYSYNGAGTIRLGWKVPGTDMKSGLASVAPEGEHEADWEHITIRINNFTREPEQVFFAQHDAGQWVAYNDVQKQGTNITVFSSKNGHASYPNVGEFYNEHKSAGGLGFSVDLYLTNLTSQGMVFDGSKNYEIISASYLGNSAPVPPTWVNYWNRWGPLVAKQPMSESATLEVLDAAVTLITGAAIFEALKSLIEPLLVEFAVPFAKSAYEEEENGPTSPIEKPEWLGEES